jgi:predicted acyl esterase
MKDEQGRRTRFWLVAEKEEIEATGVRKSDFDDAKADPASPSDCQGYGERHYRKSEHRIPMRNGVRLFTQVYRPVDQTELHPIMIFRTPYGIPPYGETMSGQSFPLPFRQGELYPGLSGYPGHVRRDVRIHASL